MWMPLGAKRALLLAAGALLSAGCATVAGLGAGAVIGAAAAITYDCDEAVAVSVWDGSSTRPICDATVVAASEGRTVTFSPCYEAYLGDGTWDVTASKPGHLPAKGVVVVEKERSCGEPTHHSLELTLGTPAPGADGRVTTLE
jgi:hypothetical protein